MNRKTFTIIFLVIGVLIAGKANAAQLKISSPSISGGNVTVGSEVILDVLLNSNEGLNALEGSITINSSAIEVQDINTGNSIISLWIDGPKLENGKIVFAGAVPGGFNGQNGKLFSVRVLFKNPGIATLSFANLKGYQNDGEGTSLSLSGSARTFRISKTGEITKDSLDDSVAPEDFLPIIGSDDDIFDGKFFVTFTASDKGSGVSHYEVAEQSGIFMPTDLSWEKAESPYLLADQNMESWIFIRAIDKKGNKRVAYIQPENSKSQQKMLTITVGIVAVMLLLIVWWRLRSRKKR